MTRSLLDVNVLVALIDSDHIDHDRAHDWLDGIPGGWASCPITENGFVRVISQPRYPNPLPPARAVELLERACDSEEHEFWPCDASLLDPQLIDRSRLHGPRQVTDAYLLVLAVTHGGRLVTFDRSLSLSAVRGAAEQHLTVV